jgi:glycosyltransferase involved in cell wall biosynthesis
MAAGEVALAVERAATPSKPDASPRQRLTRVGAGGFDSAAIRASIADGDWLWILPRGACRYRWDHGCAARVLVEGSARARPRPLYGQHRSKRQFPLADRGIGVSAAKNVLICNERFLARFGHDRSLVLLGRELTARGYHVAFACLRCEHQVLAAISNDIKQLSLPDDIEFAAADRVAAEMIQDSWAHNRPDILVTGGWPFFELAARSAAYGIPSLFIDPGAVPHDGYREPSLSVQREVRRLRRRTLPMIDCILPYSDFIRDSQTVPDRGHEEGVTTVRLAAGHLDMGFDPEKINVDVEQDLLARLLSFCREGIPLIVSLGRFEDEGYKNSPMVFDVFRMVRADFPGARLLVLGGPTSVAVPPDLSGNTICLSTLSDATLQSVMHLCNLGLSLSLWEGFNLPLAEMQWIGRPVLAFNVAAHPEVVADPWFLCASSTEMARKAVRILRQDVPATIATRKRFEHVREHLGWANTFARWTAEIEALTASRMPAIESGRRLVLVDVTNSGADPANTGVINVTRRLTARLPDDPELFVVFGIWDRGAREYVLPTPSQRSFLESYGGPKDWQGRLIEQLGEYVPLERVLEAADPRCIRPPVLFCPEVALDGSTQDRVSWGRESGFQIAFILYDMLPIYHAEYFAPAIVEAFAHYIDGVLQADAIWPISQFTLSEFERYCDERGVLPPANREAVDLPGQIAESRTASLPDTKETRMLCVSTIEPRKNHHVLVEAFDKLRARRPDLPLRLILIGNSHPGHEPLAEWLRDVTRRDHRIEWRGSVSQAELETEYASAAFSIYPSLVEGFGLPIMESLWMGRPCICHEAGVMAALAAGGGCITVDVTDPIELSFAMERLCADPTLVEALRRQATARPITTWEAYGASIAGHLKGV